MKIPCVGATFPNVMKKKEWKAFIYLAPALLLALLFSFLPLAKSLIGSFLTISQSGKVLELAGLRNYASTLTDSAFLSSVGNTLRFIIIFLPLNTLLTLLAATLTRRKSRISSIGECIFISPLAFSLSALALVFKEMFRGRVSIANRILGTDLAWLDSPATAMIVLAILGVFLDFAIDYILLSSAYRSIDKSVIEAAMIDGASSMRILSSIELPLIRSMLAVTVFMAFKDALLISAPVMVLTEGGPFRSTETIMYYYYLEAFRSGNRAAENTIAVIMVAASAIIMALSARRRRFD